jgi:hypothetical protein
VFGAVLGVDMVPKAADWASGGVPLRGFNPYCSHGDLIRRITLRLLHDHANPGPVKPPRIRRAETSTSSTAALRYRDQADSSITTGTERSAADCAADRSTAPGAVGCVQVVMFTPLSPRAAADLARYIRNATGGMNSDWPHLKIIGDPGYLSELVKRHEQEQKKCRP